VTGADMAIARVAVFHVTIKFNPNLIWFLYIQESKKEEGTLKNENISEYLKTYS